MKVLPPTPIMARTFTDIAIPECFEGPGLHSNRYGRLEGAVACSAHRHNRGRETIESTLQSPQANSLMARAIISSGHTRSKLNFTVPAGTREYFRGRLGPSTASDHRNKRMARGLPGNGARVMNNAATITAPPSSPPGYQMDVDVLSSPAEVNPAARNAPSAKGAAPHGEPSSAGQTKDQIPTRKILRRAAEAGQTKVVFRCHPPAP